MRLDNVKKITIELDSATLSDQSNLVVINNRQVLKIGKTKNISDEKIKGVENDKNSIMKEDAILNVSCADNTKNDINVYDAPIKCENQNVFVGDLSDEDVNDVKQVIKPNVKTLAKLFDVSINVMESRIKYLNREFRKDSIFGLGNSDKFSYN